MNDQYIVFDDIRKEFTKDVTSFLSFNRNGTINCFNGFGDTKYFKDIGLKDINGKSIYADSSIVEFEYFDIDPKNTCILYGYFSFKQSELGYRVCTFDNSYFVSFTNIRNFKIIDTIQENKMGLIKGAENGNAND